MGIAMGGMGIALGNFAKFRMGEWEWEQE